MAHLTRGLTTEPPVRRAQRKRYASLRHERRLPRDLSPKSTLLRWDCPASSSRAPKGARGSLVEVAHDGEHVVLVEALEARRDQFPVRLLHEARGKAPARHRHRPGAQPPEALVERAIDVVAHEGEEVRRSGARL